MRSLVPLQDCYYQYFFDEHEGLCNSVYNKMQELQSECNNTGEKGRFKKLVSAMQNSDLILRKNQKTKTNSECYENAYE